jgi:hypothetical protein
MVIIAIAWTSLFRVRGLNNSTKKPCIAVALLSRLCKSSKRRTQNNLEREIHIFLLSHRTTDWPSHDLSGVGAKLMIIEA